MTERILVTGGAGFIGSNIALSLKRDRPSATVIALDNLKRRGSELTLSRLRTGGVEFMHGDIRSMDDLVSVGPANILIEASAEPSVFAGYGGDPNYLVHTNLFGAANSLEYARRHGSDFIFLSTSRVYSIGALRALPLDQSENRFFLRGGVQLPGAMYGLRAVINRCGVISGPWQMGKVDQGFVVLWLARHLQSQRSAAAASVS